MLCVPHTQGQSDQDWDHAPQFARISCSIDSRIAPPSPWSSAWGLRHASAWCDPLAATAALGSTAVIQQCDRSDMLFQDCFRRSQPAWPKGLDPGQCIALPVIGQWSLIHIIGKLSGGLCPWGRNYPQFRVLPAQQPPGLYSSMPVSMAALASAQLALSVSRTCSTVILLPVYRATKWSAKFVWGW